MLEQMTPQQFDERYAHWYVEPWGDDWERSGTIAAEMYNATLLAASAEINDSDLRKPSDYMPKLGKPTDEVEESAGMSNHEAQAAEQYGERLNHGNNRNISG